MQNIAIIFGLVIIVIVLVYEYYPSSSSDWMAPSWSNSSSESTITRAEVYCIGENVHRYPEAAEACKQLGGRLATELDITDAYNKGAHWCNIGWVDGGKAFYPMQETVSGGTCGTKGLNGGIFESQLKIGAICYGIKPSKRSAPDVLPWDTRTGQWNMPQ